MDPHDLSGFSGTVPVFPLPNVVLFPKMLLPLHIFEPRYKEMMEYALEKERLIAMALLKEGWQQDYYGNPAVHPVIGIGRILNESRLDDGRYNLILYGIARARVEEEIPGREFRMANVHLLEDEVPLEDLEHRRQQVMAVYLSLVQKVLKDTNLEIDPETPLGTLCDLVTAMLDISIDQKQSIMEELDVPQRAEQVLTLVKTSHKLGASPPPRRPSWPPESSPN